MAASFAWALGIDGIALMLIMLSVFLMPICIGASWRAIERRVPEYMAAFLLMEALMIGVFAAQDILLFYIFFEGGLIPMYLIIGIWGGAERIKASYKFFLYTLAGSVLMLVAILAMVLTAGTTSIPALMSYNFAPDLQWWLWLAFFASFAVKMPMWPVHTWLPDAHVQAPTAGSVILAGVLLKMGGYGFIRFSLPMFPEASAEFTPFVFVLSGIAVVVTSLIALVQHDMKKLIAYSSVAHMAFVTFGLFAFNRQGIEGAMMVMLSHGLVSGALFLCVGVIYDRLHTREIARYGGLGRQHAQIFLAVHAVHHGQRRPARDERVRRRIPIAGGDLRAVELGGGGRDYGHHPRRGLYALPLLAGRLRHAAQCRCGGDEGHRRARNVAAGADCGGGAVDGRLSRKLPEADARRCRAPARTDRARHPGERCAPDRGQATSANSA